MTEHPTPIFCSIANVRLIGAMAIYDSQAEASERIPHQWREFRKTHPTLGRNSVFYGASPSAADRRVYYLTGVEQEKWDGSVSGELLNLEAGEYAVVQVDDGARLRDTWIWLLRSWLPTSGRRERNAPEFEKYTEISEAGFPIGPVEIWIPLEPLATN